MRTARFIFILALVMASPLRAAEKITFQEHVKPIFAANLTDVLVGVLEAPLRVNAAR